MLFHFFMSQIRVTNFSNHSALKSGKSSHEFFKRECTKKWEINSLVFILPFLEHECSAYNCHARK